MTQSGVQKMHEFWAICDMEPAADAEFQQFWRPYLAGAYVIDQWSASTQSGPDGAPNPGYCLFHGFADAATLDRIREDARADLIE